MSTNPRHVVWFSCGAASAVAAHIALSTRPNVVVAYCDTMATEHPDNQRFFDAVQRWLGVPIARLKSEKYATVDDVFEQTRYLAGIQGARCTVEMKKVPRFAFERPDDVHIFGFTADEGKRRTEFEARNPDIRCAWPLIEDGITKAQCLEILLLAGISLPAMYTLRYRNNNCLGCVKATSLKYWQMIQRDFPEVFARRAQQSRELGVRLTRVKGVRVFLDDIPLTPAEDEQENISCGPECGIPVLAQ